MADQVSFSPSKIITYAFAMEAVLNMAGGALLVAAPAQVLGFLSRSPSFVSPIAILFTQITGGLFASFAAPLILGLKAGPREKRAAYQFLAAGELISIPILVGKWLNGTDSGMNDDKKLLALTVFFLPLLTWRVWCLGWRAEWFGREKGDIHL
jgi:hypothetical protein